MASGVKIVGGLGTAPGDRDGLDVVGTSVVGDVVGTSVVGDEVGREAAKGRRAPKAPLRTTTRRRRAAVIVLAVLAVLGIAGTIGFGLAWEGLNAEQSGEAQARSAAKSFLVDLTNFNAKTVDADFSAVSSMATGAFATQAQKFFNSSIRQDLQKALASSRGQVRALYVQSFGGGQAAVYSVVDQLYVNAKLTSPQTDVLRIVVNLSQVSGHWKVADVTVLQGPSLGTTGTSSTGTSSSGTSSTGAGG